MGLLDRIKVAIIGYDPRTAPRPGRAPLGGAPARALIVKSSPLLYDAEENSLFVSKKETTWTRKILDLQLVDQPDERAKATCYFSEAEWRAAEVGTEIPVRVEPDSRAILGVDYDAWAADVAGSREPS